MTKKTFCISPTFNRKNCSIAPTEKIAGRRLLLWRRRDATTSSRRIWPLGRVESLSPIAAPTRKPAKVFANWEWHLLQAGPPKDSPARRLHRLTITLVSRFQRHAPQLRLIPADARISLGA